MRGAERWASSPMCGGAEGDAVDDAVFDLESCESYATEVRLCSGESLGSLGTGVRGCQRRSPPVR